MSAEARSAVLISQQCPLNGYSRTFTCPPGMTVLLKSALVMNTTGTAGTISLILNNGTSGVDVFESVSIPANGSYEWQGWHVLLPSYYLLFSCGGGPFNVHVSGAVLSGVPLANPA
jgi:hypothetical protein